MIFDTIVIVDWSGGNDRGITPKADAIWACIAGQEPVYLRNRHVAEVWLTDLLKAELAAGRRVLAGFDFPFGYPRGFARSLTGNDDPLSLWAWFEERIVDATDANNRFDVAGDINAQHTGIGPFWGNGLSRDIPHLPKKGSARTNKDFAEKRVGENFAKGSFSCWQLSGAGAVGSQTMMGLPVLQRLRTAFAPHVSVWPFERAEAKITFAEVWPSLTVGKPPEGIIKDAFQVRELAAYFAALPDKDLAEFLKIDPTPEGWILGVPPQKRKPPPALRNDCFAMPQGAYWTPVDTALSHLNAHLEPVTTPKWVTVHRAAGRILAQSVVAPRAHPPTPNSAVDGYGFAGGKDASEHALPLLSGRSAAGQPFDRIVPAGQALRVLTGAALPEGVDTVVLQEDVVVDGDILRFHGPLKQGANARKAGEDIKAGDAIFASGRTLTPADLATLTACGVGRVAVFGRLRVGILSTGDELAQAGETARDDQIYDANRPMLAAVVRRWGHKVVDLGCAPDDPLVLRTTLDAAAKRCDVILTSGGASAGDEDHMSTLLAGTGTFALWRIAMKPGRPLALGLWQETPVFGLPGNPVAALVCALIFALPALTRLAGGTSQNPQSYPMPAAFTKSKKAGRREYIRARIEDGKVVAFASEGSGRVSGLSWADGLVSFGDDAETISKGDLVNFIPYTSFGL